MSVAEQASDQRVLVGHIRGAFGIKGWVNIQPYSDDPVGLLKIKRWTLTNPASRSAPAQVVEVEQAKLHVDTVVAKLKDCPDRNAAEALQGREVWVEKASLPKAGMNEFYWVDLIGCRVVNESDFELGTVSAVDDNGVHAVLSVRREVLEEGKGETSRLHLIPFVDAYVGKVDIDARLIRVDWQDDWAD
ncbi:ribosome maturation factor RimM [Piscinibacterium candidicorallinum]|uniref:Ribosome maturation factor RimM n=1 Tax=Piscinibacterium candidicorallinum TaxID=1793872 RepID=A0ABV7H3X0_9BURK